MERVTITINNARVEAPAGTSVLAAALEADIYIPHLCHHKNLPDVGNCGLCVVKIEGRSEVCKACMTTVEEGMTVQTQGEELDAMRRLAMELMLANHVDDCTTCMKYLKCELQSLIQYLGVSTSRLRRTLNGVPENRDNPLIIRDLNRCVSCGRCVRVCRDVRGVHVLDYQPMEDDRVMVDILGHHKLSEENCRFCGACIEVCPTGALRDADGVINPEAPRELGLTPCRAECPAHIDVPTYVRHIKEGRYQQAIAVIREKAPFPQSLGHVCMAFCEAGCRRKELGEPISIRELKKFAAAKDDGSWKTKAAHKPATGRKVAVVGAGPTGLTAAYYLAKQGHAVTVFEKLPVAGGMLTTGIPAYRMPRDIVQREIDVIREAGVDIRTGVEINSLEQLAGFDKTLFAIGATKGARLPIDGADAEGTLENIQFLRDAALGQPVDIKERVVVLGGGNVAFDCARTAKRLGAKQVTIACLESRDGMTASAEEIEEGLAEGIELANSRTFLSIECAEGHVAGVRCEEVESFAFVEGRLQLETRPGSEHLLPADQIIFAAGLSPELYPGWGFETVRGRWIATQADKVHTSREDIYAAGDVVYGTASVIQAIDAGRNAAMAIDRDLGGDGNIEEQLVEATTPDGYLGRDERFVAMARVPAGACYTEEGACGEAERCLQCDLRLQLERPRIWAQYKNR